MFPSTFETSPSKEKLNYVLAVLSTRKIDNGNTIKFNNKYYQPFDLTDKLICFKSHTECIVIKAFDGSLMVSIDEKIFRLKKLSNHNKSFKRLNKLSVIASAEKRYIFTNDTSMKADSFKKPLETV